MKKIKFLAIAVLAAATTVMTSCSKDNEAVNPNEPVAVRFSANTAEVVPTRVDNNNEWEGSEEIGVYMVEHGTLTVAEGAANIQHTASSAGASTDFTSATPIYFPVDGSKVDFIAYHPHKTIASAEPMYRVNVATQTSQSAIDLMWSGVVNNTNGYDKNQTAAINLPFTHQLVKLELTVTPGTGVTDLDGLQVSIKGMNTTADFNVKTGALSNADGSSAITPTQNVSTNNYEAILLPVAALGEGHKIEFAVGGNTYTWNLSGTSGITGGKLKGGNMYSYTVTLNKTGVQVTGSIVAWQRDGNSGTGTAQ